MTPPANSTRVDDGNAYLLLFVSRDLLNRHRRLSQCSESTSNKHQNTRSLVSNRVQGHYPSEHEASFLSQGTSSEGAIQALARPTASASNLTPTEYSQEQLMGKFSIHDGTMNQEQDFCDDSENTGLPTHIHHDTDTAIDTSPVFMQTQPFDIEFLSNETGRLNDYLLDIFPHIDYQEAAFKDDSRHDGGTEAPAEAPNSNTHVSPDVIQAGGPPRQAEIVADQSRLVDHNQSSTRHMDEENSRVNKTLDAIDDIVPTNPWSISTAAYDRLAAEVMKHKHVLPSPCTLPSRHRLSRFVASWIRGFHPHLPFLHLPTTSLDSMTPMLLLTLAATGSFYGFEHTHGYAMYFIAKSIITEELEKRRQTANLYLLRSFPRYAQLPTSPQSATTFQPTPPATIDMELLQALLVLVLTMSWLDGPLAQNALAMSSQLASLTRESLAGLHLTDNNDKWADWARDEEQHRTILSAYFVLNIQTICFNVPPPFAVSEMNLPLPCSEAEFKAPNSKAWCRLQKKNPRRPVFAHCLEQLLSGKPLDKQAPVTEFGNYMLLQGLLMQIYFERQAASTLVNPTSSLPTSTISLYDSAIDAWESCWDPAIESALDPSASSHGPLAFNSTAMLRLAHIHLAVGLQCQCALRSRNPSVIAQAFEARNPIPLRSPHLDQAASHAIYALRIPIRVGIAFVARGRTGHWSVQHAISNFACALFLAHWLENIFGLVSSNPDGLEGLRSEEKRLLFTIERLIEETDLEDSLGPKDLYPSRIRRLAVAVVRLWAETCTGIQVFEIVHVIGETLTLVAEMIESRL